MSGRSYRWLGAAAILTGVLKVAVFPRSFSPGPLTMWLVTRAPQLSMTAALLIAVSANEVVSLVAALLAAWIAYGLWRASGSGLGAKAFLTAFVLEVLWVLPWVLLAYEEFFAGYPPLVSLFSVTAVMLRLAALLMLAIGLLRSHLVSAWIPWAGIASIPAALVMRSFDFALLWAFMSATAPVPAAVTARLGAIAAVVGPVESTLTLLFWAGLGVSLVWRASTTVDTHGVPA